MSPENQQLAGKVALLFRTIVQQQLLNKLAGAHRTINHYTLPPWASVVHIDELAQLLGCADATELLAEYDEAIQTLRRFEYLKYGAVSGVAVQGLTLSTQHQERHHYLGQLPATGTDMRFWYFYISDRGREFIRQMHTDEQVLQYLGMFRTNTSAAHG